MIDRLQDKYQRVILWGCEERGLFLHAELAFFASNLRREEVEVSNSSCRYLLKIEPGYLSSNFPIKAQQIAFSI
jgi:hypothetical protein